MISLYRHKKASIGLVEYNYILIYAVIIHFLSMFVHNLASIIIFFYILYIVNLHIINLYIDKSL